MAHTQNVEQLDLFVQDNCTVVVNDSAVNGSSVFKDPAFAINKNTPVHRWVPWIAGFSREFVRSALERYIPKSGTVLDPFSGVGTTLVEAILAGHDAFGFEINPYAALACRTKINAYRLDDKSIHQTIDDLEGFYNHSVRNGVVPSSKPPREFKTRGPFYSPKVMRKVLILQDFISKLENSDMRDLFKVAFGATMVVYSNYSYEPSLGRRVSAGKANIEDFPVGQVVVAKLRQMAEDMRWMRSHLKGRNPRAQVYNESFFNVSGIVRAASVDLLITSPPYLNNYHYNRNTRPHLYWLGLISKSSDMKKLEENNFGKYWQTVREATRIDLDFDPKYVDIVETLHELRGKTPEKGIYGGNGWANYAASYFNDCYRFAKASKYVLKRGGVALVVIGNSILQGVMIPTDRYLAKIAECVGLEIVDIHIPRATRVGNSIIQSEVRVKKAKDSHQLYEAVVVLRKP